MGGFLSVQEVHAMASETPERRLPEEEERERARSGAAEGTQLPSEQGQGPGAGETPIADVEVERDATDDVPTHPSLGSPPRRDESRPVYRSSQLQEGEEYEDSELRG
jgi:hypothetical protein